MDLQVRRRRGQGHGRCHYAHLDRHLRSNQQVSTVEENIMRSSEPEGWFIPNVDGTSAQATAFGDLESVTLGMRRI